jgi:O-antigen/teichoic acid export membrane protein
MFVIVVLASCVVLVSGALIAWYINDLLKNIPEALVGEARRLIILMFCSLAVTLAVAPFAAGIHIRQKFVLWNLIELGSSIVQNLLLITLLFGFGPRVVYVGVAQLVGRLIANAVRVVCSLSLVRELRFRRNKVRWQIAREILPFNLWNVFMELTRAIREASDPLILLAWSSKIDVNAFYLGSLADRRIREFVLRTSVPVRPMLTAMYATQRTTLLQSSYLRGGRVSLWSVMAISVPLIVFREEILGLYLSNKFDVYRSSAPVLGLLLVSYCFLFPRVMLYEIAVATVRLRAVGICSLASQAFNVGLTLYFVAMLKMGAIGSAAATLITEVVWNLAVFWPIGLWLVDVPLDTFVRDVVVRGLSPAFAAALICEVLRLRFQPESLGDLLLCVTVGMLVYPIVLFRLCLTAGDRHDLRRFRGKLLELAVRRR